MKRFPSALAALAAGATGLLSGLPAQAHGVAGTGALAGFSHPLLGLDHLLMLVAAGSAASLISGRLLLWALGGALIGATAGFAGITVPSAELMAALAISLVALLTLTAGRIRTTVAGAVVSTAIAVHALLHGLEAPKDSSSLLWWAGALLSSLLVCGGTYLLLKPQPLSWTRNLAIALLLSGGLLALA